MPNDIIAEITRIAGNISAAYTAARNKGATMPQNQNSDNLASTVASIPTGTARSASDVTVSGATVTVPAGLYGSQVQKSVASGTLSLNTPTVNASGLVTASATLGQAGYISSAPSNKTLQLSTQAAKTVTPTESAQTAVASGKYTTGAVTVAAIPSNYIGSGVQVVHVYSGSGAPSTSTGTDGDLYLMIGG